MENGAGLAGFGGRLALRELLQNCSANIGHVINGTPALTPSNVEFHPQCVKNPPTALCDSISTCGDQPRIRRHLPRMKGLLDASKPNPSSINCDVARRDRLPRQTYSGSNSSNELTTTPYAASPASFCAAAEDIYGDGGSQMGWDNVEVGVRQHQDEASKGTSLPAECLSRKNESPKSNDEIDLRKL
ncbi:hypothetical protein RJ640_024072 [Escallonia rubra]|uniref:Uncharacterized protein n=1 Tax=Escallonia rubra TaxID=112253 RepID=A0AA88RYC9_9ASTE|nr:hypothetical protein RJ640_024072 [Escallonia rubra]